MEKKETVEEAKNKYAEQKNYSGYDTGLVGVKQHWQDGVNWALKNMKQSFTREDIEAFTKAISPTGATNLPYRTFVDTFVKANGYFPKFNDKFDWFLSTHYPEKGENKS